MSEKDESERGAFREEREVGIYRKKVRERESAFREKDRERERNAFTEEKERERGSF